MAGLVFSDRIKGKLNKDQLENLKKSYLESLEKYPFPKFQDWSYQSVLRELKRDLKKQIGPYTDITIFEAANRIATDLTMMDGILKMFSNGTIGIEDRVEIRLGTMQGKDKGDFTVYSGDEIEKGKGESFNVASSFFRSKMSKTLRSWKGNSSLKYIIFNEDCLNTEKLRVFYENRKQSRKDIEFVLAKEISERPNIRKKKALTFADLSPEEQRKSIEMTDRMFTEVMSTEYQKEEFE